MQVILNRFTPPKSFRSLSHFADFADSQGAQFDEIKRENPQDADAWGNQIASHWKAAAAQARSAEAIEQVNSTLINAPVFERRSELARLLFEMVAQGRLTEAREIVPFLSGSRERTNQTLSAARTVAHAQFATAIALQNQQRAGRGYTAIDAAAAAYEERLGALLESDAEELESQREQFETFIASAQASLEGFNERAADDMIERSAEWLETHSRFVEQLEMKTAVDLWKGRSELHYTRYKGFRKYAIGFGILGLLTTIIWIFAGFALARYIFDGDTTAQLASYTGGSIALFTLYVWGLRVLIRSMMSEDHLSTDASARSALAHTYLALTENEDATKEDRAIILASLFAPVSDGLVKDDGMPTLSPTAMAAQILTRPN